MTQSSGDKNSSNLHPTSDIATEHVSEGRTIEVLKVAVEAGSTDLADLLWKAIADRFEKKFALSVQRSERFDAAAIVYLLTVADTRDPEARSNVIARILHDAATIKIVVGLNIGADGNDTSSYADIRAAFATQSILFVGAVEQLVAGADLTGNQMAFHAAAKAVIRALRPHMAISRSAAKAPGAVSVEPSSSKVSETEIADGLPGDREMLRVQRRMARKEARRNPDAAAQPPDGSLAVEVEALSADRSERKARLKERSKGARQKSEAKAGKEKRRAANGSEKSRKAGTRAKSPKPANGGPLTISIACAQPELYSGLAAAIRDKFQDAGADISSIESDGDIRVFAFDSAPLRADLIAGKREKRGRINFPLRIFLERSDVHFPAVAGTADELGGSLIRSAIEGGVAYIRTAPILRRLEAGGAIPPDSAPGTYMRLAAAISDVIMHRLSRRPMMAMSADGVGDLAAIRMLATAPPDLLAQLRWESASPPRAFGIKAAKEPVEDFVNCRIRFADDSVESLALPITWSRKFPNESTASHFLGLEFLGPVLAYWFGKAGGKTSELTSDIDLLLKDRGVTAVSLLSGVGATILDFARNNPIDFSNPAWRLEAVSSRLSVLSLYMLCAMLATKRKIKFDDAASAQILQSCIDHIEILRSDVFYRPVSLEGVHQDCFLVAVAVLFRKTLYGEILIKEVLERLDKLQLEPGLTSDGVWRGGSLAVHSAALGSLTALTTTLSPLIKIPSDSVIASAKKMTVFLEAMLKSDGHPIAIDESRSRSYLRSLEEARRVAPTSAAPNRAKGTKGSLPRRLTDTYIFRDAQYFISHSAHLGADSSQLAVHAAAAQGEDPGGISIAYAHGPTDLLIRTRVDKRTDRIQTAVRFDAALRNGYRVKGLGYAPASRGDDPAARIVKSWRGPNWAAAKCVDGSNAGAMIRRVLIHLKEHHALIVIDNLESVDEKAVSFEQFWNVSSVFLPPENKGLPLKFIGENGAEVSVTFDRRGQPDISIEMTEAGPRIRRLETLSRGVVASLFQWNATALSIDVLHAEADNWTIGASGNGFRVEYNLDDNELRQTVFSDEQARAAG